MNLNKKQIRPIVGYLGFLIFSSLASSSFGQDRGGNVEIKRDTVVTESEGKYPVVTNKFWDNWFIGAGAGAQMYFGDHDRQMKFSDRLTPAFDFYLGKWFSPGIGVRAAFGGFKVNGLTQNGSHSTGEVYDASKRLEKQEMKYYHAHADVLFNLSNILAGYKADRFYTISPYVGLGWMRATEEPKVREISASTGLFNTFRLGEALDFTIDVRGGLVNDRLDGEVGNRKDDGVLSATAGLVYKFKKRGWEKPKTTVISYDDAALAALRSRVGELERDNDALRKLLADSKNKTVTDVKVENRVLAAPILVTFPINQSVVSNEARANLGFFAEVIKKDKSNVSYKVTGYADKGTGTPSTNERLSKERAEAIYNVLVNEFGVSPAQLEVSHEGGVDNMFYNDPRLSRAVITIAK